VLSEPLQAASVAARKQSAARRADIGLRVRYETVHSRTPA
jgi:hypothetical protein